MSARNPAAEVQRLACIDDLKMVVENVRATHAKLLEQVREPGPRSERDDGKLEGAFLMARGLLLDELLPMLQAWENREQFSQVAVERMATSETYENEELTCK